MILPIRRILPVMLVKHQQGQSADQVFAAGEALPPGGAIRPRAQIAPQPLPARYPGIIRRGQGHAGKGEKLRDAFPFKAPFAAEDGPPLLPHIRGGHRIGNVLPPGKGQDAGGHLVRPLAADIQLPVGEYPPLPIHPVPEDGAGIVIPPVDGAEPPPPGGQCKGRADVPFPGKLREELACQHVPIPFQMGPAQGFRQSLELADIIRVRPEKDGVIPYPGRDKCIVLLLLPFPIPPVDKQPLYPAMARAPGVAGIIHPRPQALFAGTVAGSKEAHLGLGKMGGLLQADDVIFLPLVLINVALAVAIAQPQPAPRRKAEGTLPFVILGDPLQFLPQRHQVVFPQLRQRTAQQQSVEPGLGKGQQHQLPAHGPALSAPPGPSIGRVPGLAAEEFRLPGVWQPL